jgi:hypothetical protein
MTIVQVQPMGIQLQLKQGINLFRHRMKTQGKVLLKNHSQRQENAVIAETREIKERGTKEIKGQISKTKEKIKENREVEHREIKALTNLTHRTRQDNNLSTHQCRDLIHKDLVLESSTVVTNSMVKRVKLIQVSQVSTNQTTSLTKDKTNLATTLNDLISNILKTVEITMIGLKHQTVKLLATSTKAQVVQR